MSKETIRRTPAISKKPAPTREAADPPPYTSGAVVCIVIPARDTGPPDSATPGGGASLYVACFAGRGDV